MTVEEYGKLLNLIRNEIETAAAAFYTAQAINNFALADNSNHEKLNRDARFWNLQVHGLQTAYLMGLGRLFDKRSDTHTITELLGATEEHRGFFSKDALRMRKLRISHDQHKAIIEKSLEGIWEPTRKELREFRTEVGPSLRIYRERYETIRHEIFAHTGKDQQKVAIALSKTLLSEIDMMLFA